MPVSAAGEKFLRASSRIKRTIYIPVKRIHRDSSKLSRVAAGLRCVPAWITLEGEIMKFTENARWDGGSGSRWRVTRRRFWMTVAVLVASAATTALAARGRFDGRDDDRDEDHDRGRYAIGLWGDLPYSDVQAQTGCAKPDCRHELAGPGVHRARRRPQSGQRNLRLHHAHDLRRRLVPPGPCLSQLVEGAGNVYARRQRLDGLRPRQERWLQLARAPRPRAGGV